jgi:predicted nucleic acid-binding protein
VGDGKKSSHLTKARLKEEECLLQIAALTIQLAWRRYYRRKLLKSASCDQKLLETWDPEVVAAKQQSLVTQIYSEDCKPSLWTPSPRTPCRPLWLKAIPSPAGLLHSELY